MWLHSRKWECLFFNGAAKNSYGGTNELQQTQNEGYEDCGGRKRYLAFLDFRMNMFCFPELYDDRSGDLPCQRNTDTELRKLQGINTFWFI